MFSIQKGFEMSGGSVSWPPPILRQALQWRLGALDILSCLPAIPSRILRLEQIFYRNEWPRNPRQWRRSLGIQPSSNYGLSGPEEAPAILIDAKRFRIVFWHCFFFSFVNSFMFRMFSDSIIKSYLDNAIEKTLQKSPRASYTTPFVFLDQFGT